MKRKNNNKSEQNVGGGEGECKDKLSRKNSGKHLGSHGERISSPLSDCCAAVWLSWSTPETSCSCSCTKVRTPLWTKTQ